MAFLQATEVLGGFNNEYYLKQLYKENSILPKAYRIKINKHSLTEDVLFLMYNAVAVRTMMYYKENYNFEFMKRKLMLQLSKNSSYIEPKAPKFINN